MKAIKFNWKELDLKYDLYITTSNYSNNGRLYVGLVYYDTEINDYECFTDLTINIPMYMLESENEIILSNDTPKELIDLLLRLGIITDTYKVAYSGYSQYQVVLFNKEVAKEYMLEKGLI